MIKILTLILFLCLFQPCTAQDSRGGLFTAPREWPIPDSVSYKLKSAFKNGYVEYFTVNNSKFRFKKSAGAEKYELQVLISRAWKTDLTLPLPKYTFFLSPDYDKDGFFDLSYIEGGDMKVYFFDNKTRQFKVKPVIFSYDHALLDSSRVIYGCNTKSSNTWNIDIFSLKGQTVISLFKSKIFFENYYSKATYALVYKCNNNNPTDTVLIDRIDINKQWADFGLNKFMKDIVQNKTY